MSEDTSVPSIVGPSMDGTLCLDCPLNFLGFQHLSQYFGFQNLSEYELVNTI